GGRWDVGPVAHLGDASVVVGHRIESDDLDGAAGFGGRQRTRDFVRRREPVGVQAVPDACGYCGIDFDAARNGRVGKTAFPGESVEIGRGYLALHRAMDTYEYDRFVFGLDAGSIGRWRQLQHDAQREYREEVFHRFSSLHGFTLLVGQLWVSLV